MPRVSVIIPAFNRAHYIGDAVHSILTQTLDDLELIVVDDGSTDDTAAKVAAIRDPRLRLVSHAQNRGIPAARNTGLDQARGSFIAWLDSDDIARPHRLEEQVAFLSDNPSIAMVGSCAGKIGPGGGRLKGTRVPPLSPSDISAWLLFRSPFQQSSVMGRGHVLRDFRYRGEYPVCEDLDMFVRISRTHRLQNMPRVLIDRRIHPDQSIRLQKAAVMDCSANVFATQLADLGMRFSAADLERHVLLGKPWEGNEPPDRSYLDWAQGWMRQLREHNGHLRHVDDQALDLAIAFFWLRACKAARTNISTATVMGAFLGSRLTSGLFAAHGRAWIGSALSLLLLGS